MCLSPYQLMFSHFDNKLFICILLFLILNYFNEKKYPSIKLLD